MRKLFILLACIAAAGCQGLARPYDTVASPCAASKVSYECQVEQYQILP